MLQLLHCRLFAEKATGKSQDYFSSVSRTRSVEDTLDEVLSDHVQGAIVDTGTLAIYKHLKPGRFNQLKVAAESEPFPPAVIAYREGCLSDTMLSRLKEGLIKINQTDRGRESLSTFRVTGFRAVPADFQQNVTDIIRAYPAPEFSSVD